jgi:parvulin-like peptidyl-prolyl isomerase
MMNAGTLLFLQALTGPDRRSLPVIFNSRMRRAVRTLLVSAAALFGTAALILAAELVERIVARVNDRLITQSEFDKRVEAVIKGQQAPRDPGELRRQTLDELIKEKLLEERAKELSVTATDAEIDEALSRVKAQYNLNTDAEFDAALAQSGMTREELRKQLKDTITIQKVVSRDVTSHLEVTEDMMRLEYERQKEKLYAVPEQAHVWEILLQFDKSDFAGRQRAAQKMVDAQARLKGGAPFADVAREYSEGTAKERGGDLGTVVKGELLPALDAAVFSDPPVELPPPVILPTSIHLLRVEERKPAGFKPFNDVKEQIKKKINDELYDKRLNEYVVKLRREAFVKIYDTELAKLEESAEKKS